MFPLRRCDWEGGGGAGAGAALFAAAAAVEGGGGARGGGRDGRVSAEDVPREERLRYRSGGRVEFFVIDLWDTCTISYFFFSSQYLSRGCTRV